MSTQPRQYGEKPQKLDMEQIGELQEMLKNFVTKAKGSEAAPPISELRCNHSSHVNGGQ